MTKPITPAQLTAMAADLRDEPIHDTGYRFCIADALEAQAAEIARLTASLEGTCDLNVRIMDRLDGWQNRATSAEAKVAALTAVNEALHQAQPYRYIGKNGKSTHTQRLRRSCAKARAALEEAL